MRDYILLCELQVSTNDILYLCIIFYSRDIKELYKLRCTKQCLNAYHQPLTCSWRDFPTVPNFLINQSFTQLLMAWQSGCLFKHLSFTRKIKSFLTQYQPSSEEPSVCTEITTKTVYPYKKIALIYKNSIQILFVGLIRIPTLSTITLFRYKKNPQDMLLFDSCHPHSVQTSVMCPLTFLSSKGARTGTLPSELLLSSA